MNAHIIEPSNPRTQPARVAVTGVVSPVGTFASGQSASGSFLVAAEAKVGSYASGLAADRPPAKR